MRKSNRPLASNNATLTLRRGLWRGGVSITVAFFVAGCGGSLPSSDDIDSVPAQCTAMEERLTALGARDHVSMSGRATIDVNQYQVRGQFVLKWDEAGNMALEFASTTMIGGHREDALFSLESDTLRLLDFERGEYYEGSQIDTLVAEGADMWLDVTGIVNHMTLRQPVCSRLSNLAVSEDQIKGRIDGRNFEVSATSGRIVRAVWPLPVRGPTRDQLKIDYRWDGDRLKGVTLRIPGRRWRVKLDRE